MLVNLKRLKVLRRELTQLAPDVVIGMMTSASVIKAYAVSRRQQQLRSPVVVENDPLDCKVDTRALGIRLDLAPKFLGELVQLLAPDVLARVRPPLGCGRMRFFLAVVSHASILETIAANRRTKSRRG